MLNRRWTLAAAALAASSAACSNNTGPVQTGVRLANPDSLTYVLLPGVPGQTSGVMLAWAPAPDQNVTGYVIYGRASASGAWNTLASTGATVYFDPGTPLAEYYVASEDQVGDVSSGTPAVAVDTASPFGPPDSLAAIGINTGVKLHWSADARLSNPGLFAYYRVFSEPASGSGGSAACPNGAAGFALEGTTVSEDFVVAGLTNGSTWCYGVSTVSVLGQESLLTPWIIVSPNAGGGNFDITTDPRATVVMHRARLRRSPA